jgi:LysM domain-containing protein
MSDTLFADVSEFQVPVNDTYPYRFLSIRSNDGTYRDKNFAANLAWCKSAVSRGRLDGFLVYFVWHPNWQDGVNTLKAVVGTPHPKMAVMIDVESWSGKITGNQSGGINAARESLIAWLGGNRNRVIGYANAGDFGALWPTRGDCKVILANYSNNPAFPGKIAHQFSDCFAVPPFGHCDINSADGYTSAQFAAALGLGGTSAPVAPEPETSQRVYTVIAGDTLSGIADRYGTTYQRLAQLNGISPPYVIQVGQTIMIDAAPA